jgi:hypothetical protein
MSIHESPFQAIHRELRPQRIRGAGQNCPALRDRVDLAFVVSDRSQGGAVIEVRPAVPFSVPAVTFQLDPQLLGLDSELLCHRVVTAEVCKFDELPHGIEQKEPEPNAFPFAPLADQIHAVVPIAASDQGQAMFAKSQTASDRSNAVFIEGRAILRDCGKVIMGFFIVSERSIAEEGDDFVKDTGVTGLLNVAADRDRQPQIVIGEMGAHAAALGRVPPMLDVPFAKLLRGGSQQMLAEQVRLAEGECHCVLQLVSEPEGAA